MPLKPSGKIWMNGKLVKWNEAKVHVLTHALHYGSSWFEGIRCYDTKKGLAIFRLDKHLERLFNSTTIYRAEIPYTIEELEQAVIKTIKVNRMKSCYIRPLAYRGYGEMGLNPLGNPIDVSIAVWEWGAYLGADSVEKGIDVRMSSWMRPAPNTLPTMSKAGGNYLNAQLIKMEALTSGFAEGIALDRHGHVSEGSGENIFIVKDGVVYTPPVTSSILPGITRDSVMTLLGEMGIKVLEVPIEREMLLIADELFFTGTAVEITPIRSVDRHTVDSGKPGPVTRGVQKSFFDIVRNGTNTRGWLKFL